MSQSSYFSIFLSYDLIDKELEVKKDAIRRLQDYFERNPNINTGDDAYYPASYATTPFLDGREDAKLKEVFRAKVLHAELTESERVDVQRLGFSLSVAGPHAFAFYNKPETLEP